MAQDEGKTDTLRCGTYLEVASKLMALASDSRTPETREQFILLAALYQSLARSSQAMEWPPLPPVVSLGHGVMHSSWQGNFFHYRRQSVLANAPSGPGVYALWSPSHWVYIGESSDLRGRLLAHLDGDNECLLEHGVRGFGFERIEEPERRAARVQLLLRELTPICNPAIP